MFSIKKDPCWGKQRRLCINKINIVRRKSEQRGVFGAEGSATSALLQNVVESNRQLYKYQSVYNHDYIRFVRCLIKVSICCACKFVARRVFCFDELNYWLGKELWRCKLLLFFFEKVWKRGFKVFKFRSYW